MDSFIKKSSLQVALLPTVKISRANFDISGLVAYKTYYGIKMKPLYGLANLLSIPFIQMLATMVGQFVNTQMVFILRDPHFFNIPKH